MYQSLSLAVRHIDVVYLIKGMQCKRTRVGFEVDQLFVDQGDLHCLGLELPIFDALEISVVVIDSHEFVSNALEDVEHSPFLSSEEVKFDNDIVDLVQVLQGESLESSILAALAVRLQRKVFVGEVVDVEDVFEGVKSIELGGFGCGADADIRKVVHIFVFGAEWSDPSGAVVLIVVHRVPSSQIASKTVICPHPDVQQSFRPVKEITAQDISSIVFGAVPHELAVCVLSQMSPTLQGLNRLTNVSSKMGSYSGLSLVLLYCRPGMGIPTVGQSKINSLCSCLANGECTQAKIEVLSFLITNVPSKKITTTIIAERSISHLFIDLYCFPSAIPPFQWPNIPDSSFSRQFMF